RPADQQVDLFLSEAAPNSPTSETTHHARSAEITPAPAPGDPERLPAARYGSSQSLRSHVRPHGHPSHAHREPADDGSRGPGVLQVWTQRHSRAVPRKPGRLRLQLRNLRL